MSSTDTAEVLAAVIEASRAVHDRSEVHFRSGPAPGTHVVVVMIGMAEILRSQPLPLQGALRSALDKLRAISTRVLTNKIQQALEEEGAKTPRGS